MLHKVHSMSQSSHNLLHQGLQRYLLPEELQKISTAKVGIAGAGGLGSNVAMLLTRSGVQHFVLIDDDTVEASNLNRQLFFPRHVGLPKVDALADILSELNPHVHIEKLCLHLHADNIPHILPKASLWIEALDAAQSKRLMVEQALLGGYYTVSASGIAGCDGPPMQKRHMGKNLVIVGDFSSDIAQFPPLAPRVMQAAALQADALLAHILRS